MTISTNVISVDPVIAPSPDRKKYILVREMDFFGTTIPAGFIFDGASVPRFFWRFVPPGRPWLLRAACGHDFLYERALYNKAYADKRFYKTLIEDGAPKWLAKMMYQAVKFGGKGNY